MSQEKIDDLLRQSFDEERNIPFDESAWQALSEQLPIQKKRYILPLWAILFLGSGWLLTAALLLWSELSDTSPIISNTTLEEPIAGNTYMASDTVYLQQVVVVKDTIIQYRYLNTQHKRELESLPKIATTNQLDEVKSLTLKEANKDAPAYLKVPRLIDNLHELPVPQRTAFVFTALPVKERMKKSRLEIGVEAGTNIGNVDIQNDGLLNRFILRSFIANLSVDEENSQTQYDSQSSNTNFIPVGLYQYGIKANYQVLNNLFVQLGVGQESISYENNTFTPFDRAGALSALRSFAGTDQLLTQRSMYYELGLQRRFGNRRIQPIAHVGLRMRSNLNRITQSNTFSDQPSYIYNYASNSVRLKESNGLRLEQIRMGLGAHLQLAQKWSFQASIDSYSSLRADEWIKANWGLNVGLFYSL